MVEIGFRYPTNDYFESCQNGTLLLHNIYYYVRMTDVCIYIKLLLYLFIY